jgi:hypothetical protein
VKQIAPASAGNSDTTAARPQPISERVRRALRDYTAAEQRVARALLGNYPVAGLETVSRFAERAGTSARSEVQKQLQVSIYTRT